MNVIKKREEFEDWLFGLDDMLESFFLRYVEKKDQLDYSIESLLIVEKNILEQYNSPQEMIKEEEAEIVNEYAIYIGETIRKNLGGKWDIELNDRKFAYFGLPILADYSENSIPFCPLTLATATADRRRGNYIHSIIQNKYNKLKQVE